MKVLHVLNDVEDFGNGIINATVDLACQQAVSGVAVSVASGGGGFVELLDRHGVVHHVVDQRRRLMVMLAAVRRLRRLVRSQRVDVVHAHMNFSTVLCRVALVGTGVPLVATAHTSFKRSASLLVLADRIIAVSERAAEQMRRRGCPRRKLVVVPNGTVGSARRSSTLPPPAVLEHPAAVFVGGMYERKGVDVLIRAFASLAAKAPEATLYLLGDGPDRVRFELLASSLLPPRRVRFLGFQRDPRPHLLSAEVFVLPSRSEPWGLVITEAREAGCAIVASDVDGIPQACDWGEAAVLVPPDDPEALAAAITPMLVDEAARNEGRRRAAQNLERFSMARVAADVDGVYRAVGAGRR